MLKRGFNLSKARGFISFLYCNAKEWGNNFLKRGNAFVLSQTDSLFYEIIIIHQRIAVLIYGNDFRNGAYAEFM